MAEVDARKVGAARRWRNGLALAAVLVPAGCSALFERQARRLDALAAHGQPAEARVVRVDGQGTVFYTYAVGPTVHTWNVARAAAPFPVGARFRVVYLPEDPSFSRPLVGPSVASDEAVRNRRFARRFAAGVLAFFVLMAALVHRELGRLQQGHNARDPAAYRTRVRESLGVMGVLAAAVSAWHAQDAQSRGESLVPVAAGLVLALAVLGGTVLFVARRGPEEAARRGAALVRWLVPAAVVLAVLRLVAVWWAG